MTFDTDQPAYRRFRDILKQNIGSILVWSGAGMSTPANIPTWPQLRDALLDSAERQLPHLSASESRRVQGLLQAAQHTTNLWEAFRLLKSALQRTSFVAAVRDEIGKANYSLPPILYESLWSLGIRGMLTLNIDKFAARAFTRAYPGCNLVEFQGIAARYQADILRGGSKFVVNLHGDLDNEQSWVFTPEDFEALMRFPGYKEFINTCFLTCTIIFVGISADDRGAGGHLEQLKNMGCSLRGHYWITERNDAETHGWAESVGIEQIFYSAPNGDHFELLEAVKDLEKYIPPDVQPEPILPSTRRERNVVLPLPEDVERLTAEQIRQILNKEAIRLLDSERPNKLQDYAQFWENYSEAIHRAWSVSIKPNRNRFFSYQLTDTLAGGAFGQVYRANDENGKQVAVKVLHGNVRDEPEMLQGFRRGVRAMRILSDRNVKGMVPYIAQWEIPAATVMEYVDGTNLQDAVESGFISSWEDILTIASDLAAIVHRAHSVPEHVLHRDLRPPNIMLRYLGDVEQKDWEVVVLDFDLAWHKDAAEVSLNPSSSANGYLAPEQADPSLKHLRRNALVDSFGLGMTLFFLASGIHPLFGQQQHSNWNDVLRDKVARKKCPAWISLPRRYSRLIDWTTKHEQSSRWDFSRIQGELNRLQDCLSQNTAKRSCELIAEEIAARSKEMGSHYEWDQDRNTATMALRPGFTVKVYADEAEQLIGVEIDWSNLGEKLFENVRKYISPATDKCCKALKAGGWSLAPGDKQITSSTARVRVSVNSAQFRRSEAIDKAARGLSEAILALLLK